MARNSEIFDVKNWELPDHELYLSKLKGLTPRNVGNFLVLGNLLKEVDLYCYLKARFGPPRGFAMAFRAPSTDNLIQWNYTLMCRGNVIEVWGKTAQVEIFIEWFSKFQKKSWTRMIESIKGDFQNYGAKISEARNILEKWKIFVNPYVRLKTTVDLYAARLEALHVEDNTLPPNPLSTKEMKTLQRRMQESINLYREAAALSMSVKMLLPVLAESFVNLLVFVLRKDELKNDERLYENFIRSAIDVRIKGLHLHCTGFARGIDAQAQEFKDFHSLMNTRNDFVHGNVNPVALTLREVYFDGTIPLFRETLSFAERALSGTLRFIEPNETMRDLQTVRAFERFVLSHLKPVTRAQVDRVLNDSQPGWREDTKKVGALFTEQVVAAFLPR